jgi:hypothetical protein
MLLLCCRSYQLERAAAEVRASSMFEGATACMVPLQAAAVTISMHAQLPSAVSPASSAASNCSASKPPIAGRRSSKHMAGPCSNASPAPGRAAAGALAAATAVSPGGFAAVPPASGSASASGLIAANWGFSNQQQQQQQYVQSAAGSPDGRASTGHDSDCEEAEIDRQLAALAALRQANRRAPAAASAIGSISAKSIAVLGLQPGAGLVMLQQ